MALAKTCSIAFYGVEAHLVEVEANIGPGLPGTYIVGLASTGVAEAKDRMKTAAQNAGLGWPKTKTILSLLPGDLRKTGSHFDAAMAVAVLAAMRNCRAEKATLADTMILGEIALDGSLRAVSGVLPALLAAAKAGIKTAIIPPDNGVEAQIAPGITVLQACNLAEILAWSNGESQLRPAGSQLTLDSVPITKPNVDMNDIAGQSEAKFAAEVAAAGGHNLFLIGPPGSGKSMIAERLPTILPRLSTFEQMETTVVHSIAGQLKQQVVSVAPFVAPHHSITKAALLGGGAGNPRPGAVSLAHNGVLFLDEASEIPARILDTLRGPMESGFVQLQRAERSLRFPARFQLVLAANPCRCAAELPSQCSCSSSTRAQYLSNISGPLRDRIDIFARTYAKGPIHIDDAHCSAVVAERVGQARDRATHRWCGAGFPQTTTAAMRSSVIRRSFPADDAGMALLESFLLVGKITQRGVDRALKLAWTLSDLAGVATPGLEQVATALELREEDL